MAVFFRSNIINKEIQFELIKGKTRQTNGDTTFQLTPLSSTEAVITLARPLDYETVTEYQLTVRATNADSLQATVILYFKVEDVNDEIPSFIELVSGSVLENEEAGAEVMVVRAVDKDSTYPNNAVTYELESHKDLFEIDSNTGKIITKVKFDREEQDLYQIKITARDGAPSALFHNNEPNAASQVFRIKIEDKNDNKPVFEMPIYTANNIPENVDEGKDVIEVKALDKDTASVIEYSITNGNVGEAFFIEKATGRIKVKNKLDFEKIESYNLTVKASDGQFEDEAEVIINILNVNDELPIFEPLNVTRINILEEQLYPDCLVTVKAYDPDIKDRNADQKIVYRIGEQQKEFAAVDNGGCVKLKKVRTNKTLFSDTW